MSESLANLSHMLAPVWGMRGHMIDSATGGERKGGGQTKINQCPKKDPSGEHWEMGPLLKGDKMSRWKNGADSETGQ